MDRVIYTALTGLAAQARRSTVTANNLANAGTTGFRREVVAAEGRYLAAETWNSRAQSGAPSLATPHEAGRSLSTGRALDVALAAEAWLAVQGPVVGGRVTEAYTRRGDLTVGADTLLRNGDGRVLVNENGAPVSVPPGASLEIAADGGLAARSGDATVPLGRLKLVDGRALSGRDKTGDGLFVSPEPLPRDPAARLTTGTLESANVTATAALAELVEEQRGFEVNARLLGVAKDMDERGARLMGMEN